MKRKVRKFHPKALSRQTKTVQCYFKPSWQDSCTHSRIRILWTLRRFSFDKSISINSMLAIFTYHRKLVGNWKSSFFICWKRKYIFVSCFYKVDSSCASTFGWFFSINIKRFVLYLKWLQNWGLERLEVWWPW